MQIAVGSVMHESNTFSSVPTDLEAFKRTQYLVGKDLLKYHSGKTTELGGILKVLNENKVAVLPTISAVAMPSGEVTRETYSELKNHIIGDIQNIVDQLDGVLLALHGAMVVEGLEDPEGDLLREIRKIMPAESALAATLDMHATVSEIMVENADFLTGYRTHPHLDQFDVGCRAAQLMLKIIKNRPNLTKAFIKLPMIVPGETKDEPRNELVRELKKIETDPDVIAGAFFLGYPWADVSIMGDSVLVVTNNNQALAEKYARTLSDKFWKLRYDFPLDLYTLEEAVKIGQESSRGPTVLCEMGECLFGGASGDVVTTLRYLIEQGESQVAVAVIVDPESVNQVTEAGIGATVHMKIGGKLYRADNPPLLFQGKVRLLAKDVTGHDSILAGYETAMGRMAVVEGDGIEIILVERPGKIGGPAFLEELGIDPKGKRFIVLKDSIGPVISYKEVAKNVLLVDTPGWCKQQLLSQDYKKTPRPIFPFDPDLSWSAEDYRAR